MEQNNTLNTYVIYNNPKDNPGKWVVRRFINEIPTEDPICVVDTLIEAREFVPKHCVMLQASLVDDPVIHEVWL